MLKLTLALILIGFIYVPTEQQAPPPVLEFTIPMQPVEETENNAPLCPCVAA